MVVKKSLLSMLFSTALRAPLLSRTHAMPRESRLDPGRGFVGGYEMETLPGFGLAGVATNTVPGAWGVEYAKIIEMYDHFAGMWLVGEDLPQSGNGVTLHPTEKDQHGMPA